MNYTIWIDPDYGEHGKGCGVALWCDEPATLVDAWWGFGSDQLVPPVLSRVTYELPQADKRSYAFSPEVLIQLTAAGAELAGLYAGRAGIKPTRQRPREWKGSRAKPKMHARLWDALTMLERAHLGGEATSAMIDRAVTKGALCRWDPKVDLYPRDWPIADLLDAACMGAIYHGRMK